MKEKRSQNNSRRAASGKLAEIFTKINMSELPAMSPHVQELLALTRDRKAGAYELSEVILKDYSLTNKILQMVNSAYYGLNQQISSISRAVTILGFDTVKNMATGIAIFEDFVKSGVEQDGIVRLITKSFLSGLLARDIADNRRLNVLPEEAFICSLLHNLGKIIVYIYFPDIHRAFEEKISQGMDEDGAARSLLENMSLPEVGVELARFWNMSEKIIMAMDVEPAPPMSTFDEDGNIRCLADFSNRIIGEICTIGDITSSFAKYGKMFSLKERDVLIFLKNTIEEAQNVSSVVRKGMAGLKIRARILHLEERVKRRKKIVAQGPAIEEAPSEFDIADDKIQQDKDGKADLSADDFIRDITNSLLSEFTLNDI